MSAALASCLAVPQMFGRWRTVHACKRPSLLWGGGRRLARRSSGNPFKAIGGCLDAVHPCPAPLPPSCCMRPAPSSCVGAAMAAMASRASALHLPPQSGRDAAFLTPGTRATVRPLMSVAAPHLLEEFAPELNGTLDPGTLTTGSGRKVWWQCRTGCSNCGRHHNWQVPTVMGLQVSGSQDQCLVTPHRHMHMRDWAAQDTVAYERSKLTAHVQHAVQQQNLLLWLLVPELEF